MYSFSYLEPVCCSMSSSNCCFLTCIQVSQEAGQGVWYAHLSQLRGDKSTFCSEEILWCCCGCSCLNSLCCLMSRFIWHQLLPWMRKWFNVCPDSQVGYTKKTLNCILFIGSKWVWVWANSRRLVKDREAWRAAVHGVTKIWIQLTNWTKTKMGFPGGLAVKNPPANAGNMGLSPRLVRSPGEGNGNPFQYSCSGNPMDRGAWWATVHEVPKNQTWLNKQRFKWMNCVVNVNKVKVKSLSRVWLCCDPMDYSLPSSSVHGIFQAIVMEWVAISFSRGSSQPRDWTRVSRIAGRRFTLWDTREALNGWIVWWMSIKLL